MLEWSRDASSLDKLSIERRPMIRHNFFPVCLSVARNRWTLLVLVQIALLVQACLPDAVRGEASVHSAGVASLEFINESGQRLPRIEEYSDRALHSVIGGLQGAAAIPSSVTYRYLVEQRLSLLDIAGDPTQWAEFAKAIGADLLLTGRIVDASESPVTMAIEVSLLSANGELVLRKSYESGAIGGNGQEARELALETALRAALPDLQTQVAQWWPLHANDRPTEDRALTSSPPESRPPLSIELLPLWDYYSQSDCDGAAAAASEASQRGRSAEHAVTLAYGRNQPFAVNGQVTARDEGSAALVGRAMPVRGDPGAMGSHVRAEGCLLVMDPEQLGRFAFDLYMSDAVYYLGETSGTNGFGARIRCSMYGALPAATQSRVRSAENERDRHLDSAANLIAPEHRIRSHLLDQGAALSKKYGAATAEASGQQYSRLFVPERGLEGDVCEQLRGRQRDFCRLESSTLDESLRLLATRVDSVLAGEPFVSCREFRASLRGSLDARYTAELNELRAPFLERITRAEESIRNFRQHAATEAETYRRNEADRRVFNPGTIRRAREAQERQRSQSAASIQEELEAIDQAKEDLRQLDLVRVIRPGDSVDIP